MQRWASSWIIQFNPMVFSLRRVDFNAPPIWWETTPDKLDLRPMPTTAGKLLLVLQGRKRELRDAVVWVHGKNEIL